jgi:hypothetical protein
MISCTMPRHFNSPISDIIDRGISVKVRDIRNLKTSAIF